LKRDAYHPNSSGWKNTDAINWVACPKLTCQQPAGAYCRMPSGREASQPHFERHVALTEHPDYNPAYYRLSGASPNQVGAAL